MAITEKRLGERYVAYFPVRAEWDDEESGEHVVAEVLRLERNPAQPLAALQLLGETDEWRGLVWEPAAVREREADEDYEEYDN